MTHTPATSVPTSLRATDALRDERTRGGGTRRVGLTAPRRGSRADVNCHCNSDVTRLIESAPSTGAWEVNVVVRFWLEQTITSRDRPLIGSGRRKQRTGVAGSPCRTCVTA